MGLPFVDLIEVSKAATGLTLSWLKVNNSRALLPKQAPPYTVQEISDMLTKLPVAGDVGPYKFTKRSKIRRSFKAASALMAQAGFRGAEVSLKANAQFSVNSLTRAKIYWRFGASEGSNDEVMSPTQEQLRNLRDGDLVVVIPPPSKADKFGTGWGNSPIFLRYSSTAPINFAREMAAIEIAQPCFGEEREVTPCFVDEQGDMLQRRQLQDATRAALLATGVAEDRAKQLTLHSYRRYLACALLGQGVSDARICALLRWKSVKSLQAYAKLQPNIYADFIDSAVNTDIDCVITANLPIYDAFQVAQNMARGAPRGHRCAARDDDYDNDTDYSEDDD